LFVAEFVGATSWKQGKDPSFRGFFFFVMGTQHYSGNIVTHKGYNFDQRSSERDKRKQLKRFISAIPFGRLCYCLRASEKLHQIFGQEESIFHGRKEIFLHIWVGGGGRLRNKIGSTQFC
jgi:hypothetical protein